MSKKRALPPRFVQALKEANIESIQAFLNEGVDLEAKFGKKTVLELIPPRSDELKILLIKAGARHPDLKQSLVWACNQADPELVKILIEYGSDTNIRARSGTPLMAAIGSGCRESMELLMDAGADFSIATTTATALSKAVVKGHIDTVMLLLERGCPPDITPKLAALTPLHVAIVEKRLDCLRALLAKGADPNRIAPEVMTGDPCGKLLQHNNCPPLQLALHVGALDLVGELLKSGADRTQPDGLGRDFDQLAAELGVKV